MKHNEPTATMRLQDAYDEFQVGTEPDALSNAALNLIIADLTRIRAERNGGSGRADAQLIAMRAVRETLGMYDRLSASGQQAIDLWLDDRIAWVDVPEDARDLLGRLA